MWPLVSFLQCSVRLPALCFEAVPMHFVHSVFNISPLTDIPVLSSFKIQLKQLESGLFRFVQITLYKPFPRVNVQHNNVCCEICSQLFICLQCWGYTCHVCMPAEFTAVLHAQPLAFEEAFYM